MHLNPVYIVEYCTCCHTTCPAPPQLLSSFPWRECSLVSLSAQVCEDLKTILRIPHAEVFKASIDRPNLLYEVRPKPADEGTHMDEMARWIHRNFGGQRDGQQQSGIVYCLTRKDCETVAQVDVLSVCVCALGVWGGRLGGWVYHMCIPNVYIICEYYMCIIRACW